MPKNQLFKKIPTKEILNKVLLCFDIIDLHNGKIAFCRQDIIRLNSVEKLNNTSIYIKEISNFPFPKPLSSFIETLDKFLK